MKPFCPAVALAVLTAGCASTWSPATNQAAERIPADTSKPLALSVGVSYSDTQLVLPWFLTDIINAVNDP